MSGSSTRVWGIPSLLRHSIMVIFNARAVGIYCLLSGTPTFDTLSWKLLVTLILAFVTAPSLSQTITNLVCFAGGLAGDCTMFTSEFCSEGSSVAVSLYFEVYADGIQAHTVGFSIGLSKQ